MIIHVQRIIQGNDSYFEISGDSSESKPTACVVDGSVFVETNTGKVFFFNGKTGAWVEQFSFQS